VRHFASTGFWRAYRELPQSVRALADKNYELLKQDPKHPSLHLKQIGRYWSVASARIIARSVSTSKTECSGSGLDHTQNTID
jgi:hypothetical protein